MEDLFFKVFHLLVYHGRPLWLSTMAVHPRRQYKWRTLPTFLLTSVGELGAWAFLKALGFFNEWY
jgi:hypothetical protein